MSITHDQLKRIFDRMFEAIGGRSNRDIAVYRERPSTITRAIFFRETVWAIWVAGKSRVATSSFLDRALQKGFTWDFQIIASWNEKRRTQFMESLHGWTTVRGHPHHRPVPQGAIGRWNSIFLIARELAKYPTEQAFRDEFFGGKTESVSLDKSDIQRLVNRKIPYLKEVTAHFIIRNMGAEAIKVDRWVKEFLNYYSLSKDKLEQLLLKAGIPLGLFDAVLWSYCEMFIREVKVFRQRFNNQAL